MDYERLYFHLFGAVANAVEAMQRRDYGTAESLLIHAQQETEEQYLQDEAEERQAAETDPT